MDVVVTEEVDKGQAYVHRDSNVRGPSRGSLMQPFNLTAKVPPERSVRHGFLCVVDGEETSRPPSTHDLSP